MPSSPTVSLLLLSLPILHLARGQICPKEDTSGKVRGQQHFYYKYFQLCLQATCLCCNSSTLLLQHESHKQHANYRCGYVSITLYLQNNSGLDLDTPPPRQIVCKTLVQNHYFPKPTNRWFSTCGTQSSSSSSITWKTGRNANDPALACISITWQAC